MNVEQIAQVAHEANRVYCHVLGIAAPTIWAGFDRQQMIIDGVQRLLDSPWLSPEDMHQLWMARMVLDGWTHGPVKDERIKQHPCIVPYDELPEHDRTKDRIFINIVAALRPPRVYTADEHIIIGGEPVDMTLSRNVTAITELGEAEETTAAENAAKLEEANGQGQAGEQPQGAAAEADRDGRQTDGEENAG